MLQIKRRVITQKNIRIKKTQNPPQTTAELPESEQGKSGLGAISYATERVRYLLCKTKPEKNFLTQETLKASPPLLHCS